MHTRRSTHFVSAGEALRSHSRNFWQQPERCSGRRSTPSPAGKRWAQIVRARFPRRRSSFFFFPQHLAERHASDQTKLAGLGNAGTVAQDRIMLAFDRIQNFQATAAEKFNIG